MLSKFARLASADARPQFRRFNASKAGRSATPEQLIPSLLEKLEKQYEARIQDKEARIQDKEARIQDKEAWITHWKTEAFKLEGKLYPRFVLETLVSQIRSELGLPIALNREGVLVEWFESDKGKPFFEKAMQCIDPPFTLAEVPEKDLPRLRRGLAKKFDNLSTLLSNTIHQPVGVTGVPLYHSALVNAENLCLMKMACKAISLAYEEVTRDQEGRYPR